MMLMYLKLKIQNGIGFLKALPYVCKLACPRFNVFLFNKQNAWLHSSVQKHAPL